MVEYQVTAMERVKTLLPLGLEGVDLSDLRTYMDAKGFDLSLVEKLGARGEFAALFASLALKATGIDLELLNQYAQALQYVGTSNTEPYISTDAQNNRIDRAVASSGIAAGTVRYGEGTASFFGPNVSIPQRISKTPIAILGYGAAGIMASYALRRLGFENVTAYEKAKPLGIWGNENVYGLSRNNPLRLQFFDRVIDPAPGGGDEVRDFLSSLVILRPKIKKLSGVTPSNLNHNISFEDGESKRYPIVINTIGLGRPKPVSDEKRMVTETGQKNAGIRWQYQLDRNKVANTTIVLIGLGNSTAEMLQQIHTLNDTGANIDYRILTHYPRESVNNPSTYVTHEGKSFRVFRDTSKPNLVDYQGDLPRSRYDYMRALFEDRIVSDVTRWEVFEPGRMTIFRHHKEVGEVVCYDKVMTLIGYYQPESVLKQFGCGYDPVYKCGTFDFDGEVVAKLNQKNPSKRLRKGLFGFGSVLETPGNPNAIVIPGMLHRVGDLMFCVIMRALEYNETKNN